jgi:choline dehydrogenase-like flavoprotein
MHDNISISLLWFYWAFSRPFLRRYIGALIGGSPTGGPPDVEMVLERIEEFIKAMPVHVRQAILTAYLVLPVAVPTRLPKENLPRAGARIWNVIKSQGSRTLFMVRSNGSRARHIDRVFQTLADQARIYEDDFLRSVTVLSNIKSLFLSVYLDQEPTWDMIGYTPYPDVHPDLKPPFDLSVKDPDPTPAAQLLKKSKKRLRDVWKKPEGVRTYCVIGSGAGGAVAAYTIQKRDPKARVLILEAGSLVTNNEFQTHSLKGTLDLFMNVGATLTADQNFTFRQGRCVGGSTTVNNAICIQPEGEWWDILKQRWEHAGVKLDWNRLEDSYTEIGRLIGVGELDHRVITTAAHTFHAGFQKRYNQIRANVVPANLCGCIGCGRCNLGCQYDAKRSMLATLIPRAVEAGAILVPDAKAESLGFVGQGRSRRVEYVVAESANGDRYRVEADCFIMAPGAYAASKLLFDSGFTGAVDGVRTVGKRFTCNFGSPVIGRFQAPQNGWKGQQIGYIYHMPDERMVIETAFAPPAAIGLMAPQWGERFNRLIHAYSNLSVATPTVGSDSYGQIVERNDVLGGRGFLIDYALGEEDWRRLAKAMRMSAQALLEAGAEEVYTTRFSARSLHWKDYRDNPACLDAYFAGIGPSDYFKVESGHPQGGNVIHPSPYYGVVDQNLKVHGVNNLWICDASVIPASITVNLQFTVMALARYAASNIN